MLFWKVKWSEVKSLSHVQLFATPWTVAYQALPSMGFSRQEYWSGFAISFSRGSYWLRNQTRVSCIPGRCFNLWATRVTTQYFIAGKRLTPTTLVKSALSKAGTLSSLTWCICSLHSLKETWQLINFIRRLWLKAGNNNHLNYLNTSQSRWNQFKAF